VNIGVGQCDGTHRAIYTACCTVVHDNAEQHSGDLAEPFLAHSISSVSANNAQQANCALNHALCASREHDVRAVVEVARAVRRSAGAGR
jgi:hypothetical protein